jgi:hypothetical protein
MPDDLRALDLLKAGVPTRGGMPEETRMKAARSTFHVLAHRLGRPVSTIHPWHHLERDLDMTPLEVVLVALEIEGIENVDIDVRGLERVQTVDDLATFFMREVARARHARMEREVA